MSRFVDTQLPRIPLTGPGVPAGNFTLPTTTWMPYMWSINNVALEESAHTALALWQAGRADGALPLLKGALLDSMFLGQCPGNVGMTTPLDAFSGERYRDFADSVGITARALVEGLFGLAPDLLAGELRIRPGFPADWNHARIAHPDVGFAFERAEASETYVIESHLPAPVKLCLELVQPRDGLAVVTVNGQPGDWRPLPDSIGAPRIEIHAPPAARTTVTVRWRGARPQPPGSSTVCAIGHTVSAGFGPAKLLRVADPQGALTNLQVQAGGFDAVAVGTPGHRTVFAQVEQGNATWWQPVHLELRPPWELLAAPAQDSTRLRFRLRNNTSTHLDADAVIQFSGRTLKQRLTVPSHEDSEEIAVSAEGLPPGSHSVSVRFGGRQVEGVVVNWRLDARRAAVKWEPVNLAPYFNDRVTQIFRNEYRSPRSPFCSLAIPKQGIGGWCYYNATADVDDSGLRAAAAKGGGVFQSVAGRAVPDTGRARRTQHPVHIAVGQLSP